MTADLATTATGTVNPGSFYGRSGRGPDTAIALAGATAGALTLLAATRADPATPPYGYLVPVRRAHVTARYLAQSLKAEATLAGEVLTPSGPEPAAATAARAHATMSSRCAVIAVGQAYMASRTLSRSLPPEAGPGPDNGRAGKTAAAAEQRAAALADELTKTAAHQLPPASLRMVTGHAQVTESLVMAAAHLGTVCRHLADDIADAFARDGQAAKGRRLAAHLEIAHDALARAASHAGRAHTVLSEAAEVIRTAPPGYPCPSCGGTGTSRLHGGTCTSCRGGGTDPYALRGWQGRWPG